MEKLCAAGKLKPTFGCLDLSERDPL